MNCKIDLTKGVAQMDESETATLQPEAEPRLQIVYILTNPSMPGLVKIGRTTNLEARIASLSSPSSVPEPFHIAYAAYVEDAAFVERGLHAAFSLHRMPGREFFRLPVANAIAALSLAEVAQVSLDAERPSDTINSAIPLRTRANGNVIGIKTIREILRQYPVRRVAAVFTRVSIEHLSEIAPEVAMVRGANTDLWKAVNALHFATATTVFAISHRQSLPLHAADSTLSLSTVITRAAPNSRASSPTRFAVTHCTVPTRPASDPDLTTALPPLRSQRR